MTAIAIAAIGLCTAQGSAAEVVAGGPIAGPRPVPWSPSPRTTCPVAHAARAVEPGQRGAARWRALAGAALAEVGRGRDTPIVVGSCNGGADGHDGERWAAAFADLGGAGPVASAACASGLHALWLGATRLAAGAGEVIVLAVDALSPVSHDHFEALRVLAPNPAPWQPSATGFIPGEAAVALRLVRGRDGDGLPRLGGLELACDHDGVDALAALARAVAPVPTGFVLGQGTGPAEIDARELAAIGAAVPPSVPLATALAHFGHTVGASGLLSVALAALGRDRPLTALEMPHPIAADGRRLGTARGDALVVCRALGGACAAVGVGAPASAPPRPPAWTAPGRPPPLRLPLLRELAVAASDRRPASPPGALIVRLDAPLVPPDDARLGDRLLPSVVLEITPGFVAQLVARTWGYAGPALCLVGGTDADWLPILAECRGVHGRVAVLHVHGRDLDWAG